MTAFSNPFASEAEICALTRTALEAAGWVVYPEAGGYDLLAVAGEGCKTRYVQVGDSVGIEAKMTATAKLVTQAAGRLPWDHYGRGHTPICPSKPPGGPHFRLVVVPRCNRDFQALFRGLGVNVREVARQRCSEWCFGENGEWIQSAPRFSDLHYRREPEKPMSVPSLLVEVPAGVPSPSTYSEYKVDMVAASMRLMAGEELVSLDFCGTVSAFRNYGLIEATGKRVGRAWVYRLAPERRHPMPCERWPEIAAALLTAAQPPPHVATVASA